MKSFFKYVCFLVLLSFFSSVSLGQRTGTSLNGLWQVVDALDSLKLPNKYVADVQIPGTINQASKKFIGIDEYTTEGILMSEVYWIKNRPLADTILVKAKRGFTTQKRQFFYIKRSFTIEPNVKHYLLRINKPQFGATIFINGKRVGFTYNCLSSSFFNISPYLDKKKNTQELVIRLGAHPGVLPEWVHYGSDFEKSKWTPGLLDDIHLIPLKGDIWIENAQVSSDFDKQEAKSQIRLVNFGNQTIAQKLILNLNNGSNEIRQVENFSIAAKETLWVKPSPFSIRGMPIWTLENPALINFSISTGEEKFVGKFGNRKFEISTSSKLAALNNQPLYLRGTNLTLHRFLEDDFAKALPWNKVWVKKLLITKPKEFEWNAFRFSVGTVPDFWLDILDESGMLLQHEFFLWGLHPKVNKQHLKTLYESWIYDTWNHPSVAWWDANNETYNDWLGDELIPSIRGIDLENRLWDNGFNQPSKEGDPIEDHPYWYFHINIHKGNNFTGDSKPFKFSILENFTGAKSAFNSPSPCHSPAILNEYSWLWLHRNGEPTALTKEVYNYFLPKATNEQRLDFQAYQMAAETEYWRAHRQFFGILYFSWLGADFKGAATSDNWADVNKLQLHAPFEKAMKEAFKPLGVYINFHRDSVKAGEMFKGAVSLVNDYQEQKIVSVQLELTNSEGKLIDTLTLLNKVEIKALGQRSKRIEYPLPKQKGSYELKIKASYSNNQTTECKRRFVVY